jgi:hypothetical protein
MRLKEWQLAFESFLLDDDATANLTLGGSLIGGPTLDVGTGLAIYHNAYKARLLEVLRNDFVAIWHWMGDDEFDRLCQFLHPPIPVRALQPALAGQRLRRLYPRASGAGTKRTTGRTGLA